MSTPKYAEHEKLAKIRRKCGMTESHPYPAVVNLTKLLAEFFEIDEKKLDAEKNLMLEEMRR